MTIQDIELEAGRATATASRAASRRRRIAVFLQDLYGGGAERVMLLLAGAIARRGVDVDLVLIRREGAYLEQVPPGVRVHELGTRRMSKSVGALARYLRAERPEAVLTALVHVNVGALLAAMLAGRTRVIVTEHNQISRNYAALRSPLLRAAYRLVPQLYRRAARIVAVSSGVADDLHRFSGLDRRRIDVVHNPIVAADLPARAAEPVSHPWLRPGQPPVVMAVGRLNPQKDFETLIRAFAALRARRAARLIILGEGDERAALQRLAGELGVANEVDMPGFVDNPYAHMAKASLFVLSSRFEGLPTVLVEAMACGTPVVATDCPSGPREILEDGALGGLVPVGDADALALAMEQALDAPVTAERLKARASDFAVERAVDRYLELVLEPAR
ncbi:glycosyltransferase [Arenibaculum pallidiluteum]|uniref:glycosyltransferase n=1 Tax=Arenibaculum pallidiluteum TaxID=2812559 RepID=UPI001A95714C|nr:glycosyltransferase [Arenibaculum pallidiluteum]